MEFRASELARLQGVRRLGRPCQQADRHAVEAAGGREVRRRSGGFGWVGAATEEFAWVLYGIACGG
jgi:hypothetical protein